MIIANKCELLKTPLKAFKSAYKELSDVFPYEYTREGKSTLKIALNESGHIEVSDGNITLPAIAHYNIYDKSIEITHTKERNFKKICEFKI